MRASFLFTILALFAASALAQNQLPQPFFGFSGDWSYTGTMNIPTWASDGTCTLSSSTYHYAWFNLTLAEGVNRLSSLQDFYYVYAYWGPTGFNPTNPCQGSAMTLTDDAYYVEYDYDSYDWYAGGAYTFVLVSSSTYGVFEGQVTVGFQGATSNSSGNSYNPIYISSSGACITEDQTGYQPYYQEIFFNVSATGWWDLNAYFARDAEGDYPSYTYLSLFKGQPNATLQTDACLSLGNDVELIAAVYNSYQYTQIMATYLVAGQVYTAVVSTYNNNFWGPFALEVTTTRRFNFTLPTTTTGVTVGGFSEPTRTSSPTSCSASTSTDYANRPYVVVVFSIPSYQNFSWTFTQPNDYAFFTYGGDNEPPTTCPLTATYLGYTDSGDDIKAGPWFYNEFTVVATPYYTSSTVTTSWYTDVYVVTGPAITSGGFVPPVSTTSTGSTTGTPAPVTTSAVTTGAVTTGAVTTNTMTTTTGTPRPVSTTSTTTSRSSTTNAGSKGASFAGALLILSIFVAMMM